MNKSVLILDTPVNCDECDLCRSLDVVGFMCMANNTILKDVQNKCEDCPLKDLPTKRVTNDYIFQGYTYGYNKGFNDAIDMITGEYNNFKQKIIRHKK